MPTLDIRHAVEALDKNYILLLTTNSIEKTAFNASLTSLLPATILPANDGCRLARLGQRFVLHVTGTSGAQENKSVGRIVRELLANQHMPQPTLVILGGVCWGNPAHVSPLDVLISTEVWAVNHQRVSPTGRLYRATQRLSPLGLLDDSLLQARLSSQSLRLAHGSIASAELHLADATERKNLLSQYPFVFGGEMEAFDVVAALNTMPWILLKGVADDAGDAVDRARQASAAENAASVLPTLVDLLAENDQLIPPRDDAPTRSLLDAMIGDAIRVDTPGPTQGLNDYLNDQIGPRILSKLRMYGFAPEHAAPILRHFTDVILELSQNALRHGLASHVTVNFYETSVVLSDDGRQFDPSLLTGSAGGSTAWHAFQNNVAKAGLIELKAFREKSERTGNIYHFKLQQLSSKLVAARNNCTIRIDSGKVGELRSKFGPLTFDSNCTELYLDVSRLLMMSRRLEIVRALREILETGKALFLACRDQEDKLWYSTQLGHFAGNTLQVFVLSRE